LKLDLTGFQGYVKKTATIISDDPSTPRKVVQIEGTVKPLVQILPLKVVSFQGMPGSLEEKAVDLITTSKAFHIQKMNDDLEQKAAYKLETVEDGTHYRLRVSNKLNRGTYRGTITLYTDLPEKPELTVWVNGTIEGEIGVNPKTLVVGRLSPDQGVLAGKVTVKDNLNKPFQIVKCTYDERIISVNQSQLPDKSGYTLEVTPNMNNIPPKGKLQATIVIETDLASEGKQEVQVRALNLPNGAE
jgi:hypothetical protein